MCEVLGRVVLVEELHLQYHVLACVHVYDEVGRVNVVGELYFGMMQQDMEEFRPRRLVETL
jgi:hypothetical protein